MKNLILFCLVLIYGSVAGQILHSVNKLNGSVLTSISQVDSIRFNTNTNQMEVIRLDGTTEGHAISDIINVTFSGDLIGVVEALNCSLASINGNLTEGIAVNGLISVVPYTGGNGGVYNAQSINSTGVAGLTASLAAGSFSVGSGNLNFVISGTPASSGVASFVLNLGGQICTLSLTVNLPLGTITSLNCVSANTNGLLTEGAPASGVSFSVPYAGGNGGIYVGQLVNSTGVTGLTANLLGDTLMNGSGILTYVISGIPNSSGTASFLVNFGGQSCTVDIIVLAPTGIYPPGTIHCTSIPTAVVDVINPTTGKIWMDRNLGASQIAINSTDVNSYGDLYQWGRASDGHQCRNSLTTNIVSTSSQPIHGDFIINYDWISPQNNNLWQGVNGLNNPCPSGYRLPTDSELNAERLSWSSNNSVGAFSSPLKLTNGGNRLTSGSIVNLGTFGSYWSSSPSSSNSMGMVFNSSAASLSGALRGGGYSVRCIKN